jgi:hypothetical protein
VISAVYQDTVFCNEDRGHFSFALKGLLMARDGLSGSIMAARINSSLMQEWNYPFIGADAYYDIVPDGKDGGEKYSGEAESYWRGKIARPMARGFNSTMILGRTAQGKIALASLNRETICGFNLWGMDLYLRGTHTVMREGYIDIALERYKRRFAARLDYRQFARSDFQNSKCGIEVRHMHQGYGDILLSLMVLVLSEAKIPLLRVFDDSTPRYSDRGGMGWYCARGAARRNIRTDDCEEEEIQEFDLTDPLLIGKHCAIIRTRIPEPVGSWQADGGTMIFARTVPGQVFAAAKDLYQGHFGCNLLLIIGLTGNGPFYTMGGRLGHLGRDYRDERKRSLFSQNEQEKMLDVVNVDLMKERSVREQMIVRYGLPNEPAGSIDGIFKSLEVISGSVVDEITYVEIDFDDGDSLASRVPDGGAIEIPEDLFSDKELYEIAQEAGYLFQKGAFVELGSVAAGKLSGFFEGVPPGAAKIGVEVKGRLQKNGLDIRFILAPGGRCEYPSLHLSISKDESLQITLRLSSWSKTSSLKAANTVYLLERFDVADYAVDREGRKVILRPGEGKRGLRYIHFETKDNFEEHLGYFTLNLREHAEIIMESIRQGESKECSLKEGFPASCRVYSYRRPDGVTVRIIVDQENEVARALPLEEMSMLALTMQKMNKVMHFSYSREIDELVHDPKRVLTDADISVLGDMFIETEKATLTSQLSGVLEEYPGEFIPLSLIFTNLPRESLIYFMLNTYSGDRGGKIEFREGYTPYEPQVSVDTEISRKVARELLRPEQDRDVQFLSILYAEDMVAFAAGVKAAKAQTEKQAFGIERFTGAFYNTLRDVHWGGIMKELESAARKDETMQYQCMERPWQYFERTVDERPAEEQVDERNRFIGYMLEIEDPGLRDAVLTGFELYWRRSISYTNYVDCGMSGSLVPLESRLMELARAKGYFKTPFIQFVRAAEMKIATAGRGDAWYDLAYYFLDFVFSKPVLTGSEIAAVAEQVMAAERMSAGNGRKILEDFWSQAANIEIIPRLGDIDIENIFFSFENTIFRGRNEYYFRVIDRVIARKDSESERGKGDKRTVQERFIQAVRAHPEMAVEEFVDAPGAGKVFVDWITADVLSKGGCREYVKWFVRTVLNNAWAAVPGIGAPMSEQDFVEFTICLLELRFVSSLKRSDLKPALRAIMDNVSEESVWCRSYIMKDGSNEDFELSLFYAEGRNMQDVRMELHIAGKDELIVEIRTRHSIFSRTLSGENMKRLLALAGICWFTFQGNDAVKVFEDDLVSIMDERGMEFEPFGIADTAGLLAAVKKAVNTGKLRQLGYGWKKSVIYSMRMADLGKGSSDSDLVVELGDGRVVKDVYPRKRKTRDEEISEMLGQPFQALREALGEEEEDTSIGGDVGEDWGFEEDDLFPGFGSRKQASGFGGIWEEFRPASRKMRDMERAYLAALIWDVILSAQPASKRMAAARDFLESRMKEDINRNIVDFLQSHGIYPNEENSVLVEGIIRIYILTTHLDFLDGRSLLSDFLKIFTASPCARLKLLQRISGEVREASLMELPFIKLYTADLIFFLAGIWPSGDIRYKKLDYSFCSDESEAVLSAGAASEEWQDTYFRDKAELLRNNAQANGALMDEEEKKGIAFAGTRADIRIGDIHDYAWMAAVKQVIVEFRFRKAGFLKQFVTCTKFPASLLVIL